MLAVSLSFIRGVALGFEFPEYEEAPLFVLDLFILRVVVDRITFEEVEEE